MTPQIQELDPTTVDRIAAGEVVERPASVVKELLENALDAGAERVEVAVEEGGTDGIRVTDDGHGMAEEDLRVAVKEHTTSKIADLSDLESGVGTLGFRGEALHAIGAVSRLTIRSRPEGGNRGTELVVEGGEVVDVSPVGCPAGTTVEVRDLFSTVPARREYLKAVPTEFDHVNRVVSGYALANPNVAVSLEHNGRETFATAGRGSLRDAVMAVYGRDVAADMIAVDADGETLPPGPLSSVSGLVSHPETTRSTRDYVATFVNGRYVTAGTVRSAIIDAYGRQLAPDRFPFAALSLSLPPTGVDVNVHPRKLEVRFADAAGVASQVEAAVEDALLDAGLLRSSAPRGRSAPAQTEIDPGGTGDADDDPVTSEPSSVESSGARAGTSAASDASSTDGPDHPPRPDSTDRERDPHAAQRAAGSRFSLEPSQETLAGEPLERDRSFDRLPSMRLLGQLRETYLLAETADGLLLIDQHAADERVNYERLRDRFAADPRTQQLAEPLDLELTAREAALFDAHREALERLGFEADPVDDGRVRVRTVPAPIADAADHTALYDVLASFVGGDPAETIDATADRLLADLACYPSITGNTSLSEGSVRELLAALDGCDNPYACPHGRPVLVEVSHDEIDARFERDYPGHGTRPPE